uniref:Probable WRKY transcription factor 53 n=1 Tax=Nicotiana sylvestris TaxID=4096 RepID=A0A1U7VLX7_NICSY|nr:PREDICTED: probable WRKY transcription factor 53 [Nicotiana sylvestris]
MDFSINPEYNSLINELTQGMEHTKQLRTYLRTVASTSETTQEVLLQKIIYSYEQSLLILKWSGSTFQSSLPLPSTIGSIESPFFANGSPRNDDMKRSFIHHPDLIDNSKRSKKSKPTWTEQVRVSAESGSEGPIDDGYSWRKYGHKNTFGAKYPRSYYNCAHKYKQNCQATKYIQRSDDDPYVFKITCKGYHTCQQATSSILQPTFSLTDRNQHFLNSHSDDKLIGNSFVSPTTPKSNYFSVSSNSQMNSFGIVHNLQHSESYLSDTGIFLNLHHSDSDRTDIDSANTSTTSSSVGAEFNGSFGARFDFSIWTKTTNTLQKDE